MKKTKKKATKLEDRKITFADAKRVLEVVDKGLCSGIGDGVPGEMCVEAAVSFALYGHKRNDNPPCVLQDLREHKIEVNDFDEWSSNKARAKGMRKIAIAQLGTRKTIKSEKFRAELVRETKRFYLNAWFNILARRAKSQGSPLSDSTLLKEASRWIKESLKTAHSDVSFQRIYREIKAIRDGDVANDTCAIGGFSVETQIKGEIHKWIFDDLSDESLAAEQHELARLFATLDYQHSARGDNNIKWDKHFTDVCEIAVRALRTLKAPGIAWMDKLIPSGKK